MRQAQVQRPAPQKTTQEDAQQIAEDDASTQAAQSKDASELLEEVDAWLDEIDEALLGLDQNLAVDFLQKGGE